MSAHKALVGALLIGALAACGGGGNSNASSSASGSASAAPSGSASAAPAASAGAGGAMSNAAGGGGEIPDCGAVKAVWVNMKSHKYHEPNDPMYGKTKHGKYMCPSAAKAEGDTPAGGHMHKGSGSSDSSM